MGKRIESLDDPAFGALFTSFEHTAYRLETLQVYDVGYEEEPMRRFLAGEPPGTDPAKDEWATMVRLNMRGGKVMQRVHVVAEPLTDYLRYEISVSYAPNVDAGEDIRILTASPNHQPPWDYWLFDSRDLWVMSYDDQGRFLHAANVTDPNEIVRHCYWRDAALHHATRYHDYVRRMPELTQGISGSPGCSHTSANATSSPMPSAHSGPQLG